MAKKKSAVKSAPSKASSAKVSSKGSGKNSGQGAGSGTGRAKAAAKFKDAAKPKFDAPEKPSNKSAQKVTGKETARSSAEKAVERVSEKASEKASQKAAVPERATALEKAAKLSAPAGASDELKKWVSLKNQHGTQEAPPYRMSEQYAANSPLVHARLGWGFILSNLNDRLEVLFESGIKVLISNYKTS